MGCNGTTTADNIECIPCRVCEKGQWMRSRCNGSTYVDEQPSCGSCESCGLGNYYASGCTGVESTPQKVCAKCTKLCDPGMFVAKGCKGDADSFQDTPSTCGTCPSKCSYGFYLSELCSGQAFVAGAYVSKDVNRLEQLCSNFLILIMFLEQALRNAQGTQQLLLCRKGPLLRLCHWFRQQRRRQKDQQPRHHPLHNPSPSYRTLEHWQASSGGPQLQYW